MLTNDFAIGQAREELGGEACRPSWTLRKRKTVERHCVRAVATTAQERGDQQEGPGGIQTCAGHGVTIVAGV
jgi:hypothetical protein